ncbi:hypothetical protein HG531_006993 [Fusarium graminearum]|nr:hypothetical protein HG531_006993 [Fusarium graminearum]
MTSILSPFLSGDSIHSDLRLSCALVLVLLDTNKTDDLLPKTGGRVNDHGALLVSVNCRALPHEITLLWLDNLGSVNKLPAEVAERSDDLHGVVGEEVLGVKGSQRGVAVSVADDGVEDEGDPGTVRLEVTEIGHCLAVDALGLASAVVEDEGDVHGDVIHNTSTSDKGEKNGQSLSGAAVELEEGKQGEDHGDGETVDRDTILGGLAKEAGGTSLEGQTVQRSGRTVGVGIAGGEDGGEKQGIHEMGQSLNTKVSHSDNPRRSGSGAVTRAVSQMDANESGIAVAKSDTASQGSADKEETESEVDSLKGSLDISARVLSLSGNHGDVIGTDNEKGGGGQGTHEALETA